MGAWLRLLLRGWKGGRFAPSFVDSLEGCPPCSVFWGWIWVFGSFSVFLWCELCRPFFRGSSPEERNLGVAKHEGQMIVVFV